MKSEVQILNEYLKKDEFYKTLTAGEQMLDRIVVRESMDFQFYLLIERLRELFNLLLKKEQNK